MFRNREDAALGLVRELRQFRGETPLVLAIPRGAVPMGELLARELEGELDVVLVHKLRAPGNPEYAIGAVTETGEVLLNESAGVALPEGYLHAEVGHQVATLQERRTRFTPGRGPIDPRGRVVIVVDDGIATGSTLRAALTVVRSKQPRRLIAAVGVAPASSLRAMKALADDVVCLEAPPWFHAVGQFFEDFRQVEDEEVIEILRRSRRVPSAVCAAEPS